MLEAYASIWRNAYVRGVMGLLLLVGLYLLLRITSSIWGTFLVAHVLAYLVDPVFVWMRRYHVPRWIGVLAVMLCLILLALTMWVVLVGFVGQFITFAEGLPERIPRATAWLDDLPTRIERTLPPEFLAVSRQALDSLEEFTQSFVETLLAGLQEVGPNVLQAAVQVAGGVVQVGIQASVLVILTLFSLFSFHVVNTSVLRLFPERHQPLVKEIGARLDRSVGGYIRAQLLIAVFVGVMVWLGMALLGVPLAFGIGFIAGVFNVIPFLGPLIAFVPAILLALPLGLLRVVGVAFVFLVVNQLDGNVISPIVPHHQTPSAHHHLGGAAWQHPVRVGRGAHRGADRGFFENPL